MAKKKTRRVPQSSTPSLYGGTPPAPGTKSTTPDRPATASSPAARPSAASARTVSAVVRTNVPLSVEYKYVSSDLRRLGLTALSFFIVLIAAGAIAYFVQR
jgi:hypothetical protein